MQTKIISIINNVHILITSDEEYVPIRPICEALKVDINKELENIKRDSILSNSLKSIQIEGFGETYCISYKYASCWVYSIGRSSKSEEDQEFMAFKLICIGSLFKYISIRNKYLEAMIEDIKEKLNYCRETIELSQRRNSVHSK